MSDLNAVKDVLLEDYRYSAEGFRLSEKTGETRVNLFIAFASALLGAIGLIAKDRKVGGTELTFIVEMALLVLIVLGAMTLLRLIKRDLSSNEYQEELDRIRQLFKDYAVGSGLLVGYFPFRSAKSKESRSFGGLSDLMIIINSLLVAGFVGTILIFPWHNKATIVSLGHELIFSSAFAIGVFFLQKLFVQDQHASMRVRSGCRMRDATHAGGLVFRLEGDEVKYLVVTARNAASTWVLPKGHIEASDEDQVDAAVREVFEETGVVGKPLCFVDSITYELRFDTNLEYYERNASVRSKFFLMEARSKRGDSREASIPCSPEQRTISWLSFEEAYCRLTYAEAKHVLLLGEQKLAQIRSIK